MDDLRTWGVRLQPMNPFDRVAASICAPVMASFPAMLRHDRERSGFTVGQVAQMLEVQQAFLRRLDEFGVVSPSRSSGGQRRYSRTEVTVVQYVARLADEGMTLAAIRRVLELEQHVHVLGSVPGGRFGCGPLPGGLWKT